MNPTSAWLNAASRPDAKPIFVFQLPDVGNGNAVQFASKPGHYPIGFQSGATEPHHAGRIAEDGLPQVKRSIQHLFYGRTLSAIGSLKLIDDGSWDLYIGDYNNTMRGRIINGFVTFPGLAVSDAVHYITARVKGISVTDTGEMTLTLIDAAGESLTATRLSAGSYTSQKLGDIVKARLTSAGLVYPTDFDTTSWNSWVAPGKPGDYTVTGSWSEGTIFDIVDKIIEHTLTWYRIGRDGKFYITQFADVNTSPTVDIDLTDVNSLFEGGTSKTFDPVFRKQSVEYNGGAGAVSRTVNLTPSHPWWPTAKEGEPKDSGINSLADADLLCRDRLTLLSSEHLVSVVKADIRLLAFDLGAVVKCDLGLKNLPGVALLYHQVIAIDENPNNGETVLTIWTKLGGTPLL